jgi:hypothetical protein
LCTNTEGDSSKNTNAALRVREHKLLGPYVEGLTALTVTDFEMVQSLFEAGNTLRHTAKTVRCSVWGQEFALRDCVM